MLAIYYGQIYVDDMVSRMPIPMAQAIRHRFASAQGPPAASLDGSSSSAPCILRSFFSFSAWRVWAPVALVAPPGMMTTGEPWHHGWELLMEW